MAASARKKALSHKPRNLGPQIQVCARDFLRVLFANVILLRGDMVLVRSLSIGVKPRDPTWLQEVLQFQKDRSLSTAKAIRQHRATVMINHVPQPLWFRFLPAITPHLLHL
jgi:hypothetical protein